MIARLLEVYRVLGRYQIDTLIPSDRTPWSIRLLIALNPSRLSAVDAPRAVRLRRAIEDLGPVFIKFGQLLSTRRDLLPPDIADELARLQDQVPPFDSSEAVAIIERELSAPIDQLFSQFDTSSLAAASVAQVHSAQLPSGESVVVKVLRPNVHTVIAQDLKIIKRLARLVGRLLPDARRLRPVEVARDYERTLLDELDLRREAANASQLRRNFSDGRLVYIPEVYWRLTTEQVMVSERIHGVPVTDVDTLHERGVDMKLLAERGVEIFFTQVFRDSFFHADMHPGNIFVDTSNPADPRYLAVDCAIVGQLDESDQYYMARNLLAIFQQDYRKVAQLHIECGWVPPDTPVAEFESAMRTLCEPVFERPLEEIMFGHMLVSLFKTAGRFNMEVQPQLVLLQKTLLNIEGLGRQLYPELNLWDTAQPFLERWLAERYAPQNVLKRLQQEAPAWLETLPLVPDLIIRRLRDPEQMPVAESKSAFQYGSLAAAGMLLISTSLIDWYPPLLAAAGGVLIGLAIVTVRRR